MITDPELDAEWDTGGPAEAAEPLAAGERAAGTSRPWLWALGGVVVASAVWAGGLYFFGDRLAEPTLSYRATENLCEDFKARTLGGLAGDLHKKRPMNQESNHPAVYGAACVLNNVDGMPDFIVSAQVDLHKKVDPSTEFEVPPLGEMANTGDVRREAVPDLGEDAVMIMSGSGQLQKLKVLDGGAVFTVEVWASTYAEKNDRPATDATAVQAAMIEDMRALISALEK
ncbi:hypothetical protein PV721_41990 [Streptomyces sp. MB09-01]|uniref:hypothetical protein n=1 Tax=Streptomyces sp. MB09-01 TaxID=3028666 RepID=UPI0029B76ACE|nr:hypothetical protein [Streptomyces sp. MB09-01]MDX3540748.1 hypothetical protein [Streptomyces sp. MB09-01]